MTKTRTATRATRRQTKVTAPHSSKTRDTATRNTVTSAIALPLGFESLLGLMAFGLLCALLVIAPFLMSGFWPVTAGTQPQDLQPQAMFLGITTCVLLLLALRPLLADKTNEADATPRPRHVVWTGWLLAAFFGWCVLSLPGAIYKRDALLELSRAGGCLLWFFAARALLLSPRPEETRRRSFGVLSAIVAGALIVCGLAVVNFLFTRDTRQFSTFYNPNLFANYCAMALPLALAWLIEVRRSTRAGTQSGPPGVLLGAASVAVLMIAAGLVLTSSKGGLLSLLGGLAIWAWCVWRARGRQLHEAFQQRRRTIIVATLILAALGGGLAYKTVLPRLQAAGTTDQNSTMFRAYTWRGTLHMAQARPVLGWGTGNFPTVFPQFAITGPTLSAHQVWLQIAAENGWPALLLFVAACGFAATSAWRALRVEEGHWSLASGALGALAAFTLHGFTDAGWNITSISLLFIIVLALLTVADDATQPASPTTRRSLTWLWLVAVGVLALTTWGVQRAAMAEELRIEAPLSLRAQASALALEQARAATQADPLNARAWADLGRMEEVLQQNPEASYRRALQLQPARAANWLNLAHWLARRQPSSPEARAAFDQAVAVGPNATFTRLERGGWLLQQGDKNGWHDLEYIVKLADSPYGRYPALADVVNLDFAQAYARLAERALQRGDNKAARGFIKRALADVQRARDYEEEQRRIQAAGGDTTGPSPEELDELETKLQAMQETLQ